jgi:undecaprenyl diphosphate synthase
VSAHSLDHAPELQTLDERELRELVCRSPLPGHVAIIMDGNGRWAKRRGLPRIAGHREGVKTARAIVQSAVDLRIGYLTIYAFSSENWARPSDEVSMLMGLLQESFERELPELMRSNVRLTVIGRSNGVPPSVREGMDRVIAATRENSGLTLVVAFNYGSRIELVDTFRALARKVQAGTLDPEEINEIVIQQSLYTAGIPDPDLLIRTSGELRISNFLLWQIAYAEIWVTPTLWPDFSAKELYCAVADYQRRERRFGGI